MAFSILAQFYFLIYTNSMPKVVFQIQNQNTTPHIFTGCSVTEMNPNVPLFFCLYVKNLKVQFEVTLECQNWNITVFLRKQTLYTVKCLKNRQRKH